MAADEHYLHASNQESLMASPPSLRSPLVCVQIFDLPMLDAPLDGPFLQIVEQPKQRGFRFRYGCEGPSHGGLPGASSEKNRNTYPTINVNNYQGPARVVVQLVTALHQSPQLHAHSLVGKQCEKGICTADLQPKLPVLCSFPNLGILHVTKKNVTKTLEERMVEAFRMGHNYGVCIHPEIDGQQGEVRVPRELTDHQRSLISSAAAVQAKDMDLSVVRLMFTVFLPDSDGGFSRRLEPVVSDPIYDSKAPNASNLKIVRMDRTAGCVSGGEEVYLLCDKVQKDDIQVRFYEEDDSGLTWEALGDFSPTDVHRQFAIVFKTPKYRDQNLQKPTSVFVQLKRKSDNETSEPKPFTYHPQVIGSDKEEVQRKRQKTLPNFHDFHHRGGGPGAGGPGSAGGGGGSGCPGSDAHHLSFSPPGFFQGFTTYKNTVRRTSGRQRGKPQVPFLVRKHPDQLITFNLMGGAVSSDEDGDPEDGSGSAPRRKARPGIGSHWLDPRPPETAGAVLEVTSGQVEALFRYSVTGEAAHLLATQRSLMDAQDEDGDSVLHLAVLHHQQEVLKSLVQVLSLLPGQDVLNARNHLYQTPLHLAVLTQQREAVQALLLAGADPTLADRHGNTPLHLASQQGGDGGMVGFLLQDEGMRGLLELPNRAGLCPIHLAVLANQLSSLRELLEGGANVESQERSCGRSALHLATERDNVSLAGCLLLEGNANVDSCTFDGSTPLHVAAGRGSAKLTALLVAAGADPRKENFEPLFFLQTSWLQSDKEEGYVPGTTPMNIAATKQQVVELLNGKEYEPKPSLREPKPPPESDLVSLGLQVKQQVCQALEREALWERLAQALGLGILNTAFRLSPVPARTLLDSYEVSGGTVSELLAALRSLGECQARSILEGALFP
uniref:Nuclear factor kappa B subunit 1 n=1 Tax=Tetraodon nigroviridis TaxID=99883 RepID=H3CAH8_TETNG